MPNPNPMILNSPCSACPFRTDTGFVDSLPRERKREIVDSIIAGEVFTCHKTLKHPYDDETGEYRKRDHLMPQELVCAGATLMCLRSGEYPFFLQIAERLGMWTEDQMVHDVELPENFEAWVAGGNHDDFGDTAESPQDGRGSV